MFYQVAPTCCDPKTNIVFGTCNSYFLRHRYLSKNNKKEMFASSQEEKELSGVGKNHPMAGASGGGGGSGPGGVMKNKWVKAFKSIKVKDEKPVSSQSANQMNAMDSTRQKNGKEAFAGMVDNNHVFQEYTYKKITPCDICSQILRGHARQGLKCKLCRMNIHPDCQDQVPKCQPKSKLLLRRQRSASELDTGGSQRMIFGSGGQQQQQQQNYDGMDEDEKCKSSSDLQRLTFDLEWPHLRRRRRPSSVVIGWPDQLDHVFNTLRDAARKKSTRPDEAPNSSNSGSLSALRNSGNDTSSSNGGAGRTLTQQQTRHLTPDYIRAGPRRTSPQQLLYSQHGGGNTLGVGQSGIASSSAPSSPVHNRRLLTAGSRGHLYTNPGMNPHFQGGAGAVMGPPRMSSVDLPDENEKSISSASNSPCPSPKSQRFLPSNLYVVLYNYKPRQPDELDLKAGFKLTVIDNTDKDWWKGKCLGSVGYFPSTYVTRLQVGEKPLQVLQPLQIQCTIAHEGTLKLLRDQIVIQLGEELRDGLVLIRTAENKQGACPIHVLQEV